MRTRFTRSPRAVAILRSSCSSTGVGGKRVGSGPALHAPRAHVLIVALRQLPAFTEACPVNGCCGPTTRTHASGVVGWREQLDGFKQGPAAATVLGDGPYHSNSAAPEARCCPRLSPCRVLRQSRVFGCAGCSGPGGRPALLCRREMRASGRQASSAPDLHQDRNRRNSRNAPPACYADLFDYYSDVMPYRTQKARTGDAYV